MLYLTAETRAEVCSVASCINHMPKARGFNDDDLCSAAIDYLTGTAKFEVEEAITEFGYDKVLSYIANRVLRCVS